MEPVTIHRTTTLSPEALFAVASDIERYPDFLPNCAATRIKHRHGDTWIVDNAFRFGPLPLTFRTEARLSPPHAIDIRSIDAPGLTFHLKWDFRTVDEGTAVIFQMQLDLPNRILESFAVSAIEAQAETIADAFLNRTAEITQ